MIYTSISPMSSRPNYFSFIKKADIGYNRTYVTTLLLLLEQLSSSVVFRDRTGIQGSVRTTDIFDTEGLFQVLTPK